MMLARIVKGCCMCDGCEAKAMVGIEVGEEAYYESATAILCAACVRHAAKLADEAELDAKAEMFSELIEKVQNLPAPSEEERK